jgi:crotonobetainyl-CoA:carnitine CoA-transferase CaiB-like acyl-CoA transferase
MLTGFRVLDLTEEPGFLAGKILGDMGADVVKVEPPGGSSGRRGPFLRDDPDPEASLSWLALNTSKRGITLELASARGAELFRKLALNADVVLDTRPAGAMDALGLGDEALRAANPRLVTCAITPFGHSGPRAHFRAHDLVVVAMGGNASMTGDPDRAPLRCTMPTSFYHAAPEAALGIVMALYAREETGRGQTVDVSLQECQLSTLMTGPGQLSFELERGEVLTGRPRGRGGARLGKTREIWRAKDGWVTFGLRGGQARIPNLIATVEYMAECGMAPDWLANYDFEHYNHNLLGPEEIQRLEEAFGAFFASKSMCELYEQALERRIMLAPCNNAKEILEQPQLRERELFVTLEYPELGASIEHPDFFAKPSPGEGRIAIRRRAPRIGEHNAEVFGELGIGERELGELAQQGVI